VLEALAQSQVRKAAAGDAAATARSAASAGGTRAIVQRVLTSLQPVEEALLKVANAIVSNIQHEAVHSKGTHSAGAAAQEPPPTWAVPPFAVWHLWSPRGLAHCPSMACTPPTAFRHALHTRV
jgi:hypothetical protein